MKGSRPLVAAVFCVLMGVVSVSACDSPTSETLQAHFMPWDVLTRYKYSAEDLTSRAVTERSIKTARALQISDWIAPEDAVGTCRVEDLNARFLILDADDEPLILADRFCLCAVEDEACVSITDEMKSKIEVWLR